jgi:hypothetical protein
LSKEVEHDLAQRHVVGQHDLAAVVGHVHLHAALLVGQRHDGAHVFLRHVQVHRDDRLADLLQPALVRASWTGSPPSTTSPSALTTWYTTLGAVVIRSWSNSRSSRSCTISMCSRPRKPQRKPKAQRLADLGLVVQRGIIELELLKASRSESY